MLFLNLWAIFLLFLVQLKTAMCKNYGDAMVWDLALCHGHNYVIDGDLVVRNDTKGQSVKIRLNLKNDFDNENKYSCKFFTKVNNKSKQLLHMNAKGACTALTKYGGKFWQDVETRANIPSPGSCPIKAKIYYLDWMKIQYKDIPFLALVPKGNYRVECNLYDNTGQDVKACLTFDVAKL
ncbi:PREDICTED: uncharacterized protein LOC108562405 [Nicrophorus vespilloides]|uniref:Uncharacterized protein LOC108562405 n=1 Tax=Nicrophorus vespilloides TaxID=110193 RepID=A0ABM1MNR0_NICVS|nr:PREDICTED: uncharacterized protein LOC108562405 [Nicrophorus vespilloides]